MSRKRLAEPEGALYVRLPAKAVDKLDRAAETLGMHKKDLVARLVAKYVNPDSRGGLDALAALSQVRRVTGEPADTSLLRGSYSFHPHEPPEVLTAEQAGLLLQIEEKLVIALAEAGKLPGRKLGEAWRFGRSALLAWLSTSGKP